MGAEGIMERFEGMEKKSSILTDSLNVMWSEFGPRDGMEKNAGLEYFYDLQRDELDADALGAPFCKLAASMGKDPWELSCEVEDNLDAFEVLAKTAGNDQVKELAQFYVDWADEMEKVAKVGLLRGAWGGVKRFFGKGPKQPVPGRPKMPKRTARTSTTNVQARQQSQAHLKKQIMAKRQARGADLQRTLGSRQQGFRKVGPGAPAAPTRTVPRKVLKQQRRQQIAAEAERRGMGGAQARSMGATRQAKVTPQQYKNMPRSAQQRVGKPADPRGEGMTFGQKALGATAVGVPLVGAGMLMNKKQQPQQQRYQQGAYYG